MVHWTLSYKFGKAQEVRILPVLKEYFKTEIQATKNQYDKYDFTDPKTNYEVKSRTNKYNRYPTTMITADKVAGDKKLIFIFNFVDCLAVIEYDEERFAKYERQMFSRAQIATDEKIHLFIPIGDLEIIKRKN